MATVLVVDDNAITRKVVRVALAAEGYLVREAEDGAAAIAEVARQPPDLILQDLVLPDGSGIDLVTQLRALPGAADIPILAFSGFQPAAAKALSMAAGFTDYLFKPVEPSVLVKIVAAYLKVEKPSSAKPAAHSRILVADDEPVQLKLTALLLTGAGFKVSTVADGESALQEARRDPPDLIVSDILMPGLDGFRLCQAVRADARVAHIPVVLQTAAFTGAADRALASSVGAADFVVRSPDSDGLLAAVSRCLGVLPLPLPQASAPPNVDAYTQQIIRQVERLATINARLTSRIGWLETERAILGGLAEVLKGTPVVDSLVDELLYRFVDAAGISCGVAYLVEQDGALVPRSRIGLPDVTEVAIRTFFGQSDLLRDVVSQGVATVIPSDRVPAEGARVVLAGLGMESAIVVPLGARREKLGVIALASKHSRFDEDWRAFAEAVGVVIGQSIGLARTVVELRESEERSRRILEAVPSGVLIADRAGRLTDANAAAEHILGASREVIVTRHFDDPSWQFTSVDGAPSESFETALREPIRRGESVRALELSMVREDGGSRVAISVNAEPLRDALNSHIGTVFALTEITARKQAESELRRRVHQQEAVARYGQFALQARSIGALFDEAASVARTTLEVELAAVFELAAGGRQLRLVSTSGEENPDASRPDSIDVGGSSQAAYAILIGEPIVTADLRQERRFRTPPVFLNAGWSSGLSVIIPGGTQAFGVLSGFAKDRRGFSEDDVHFFRATANTLAAAIARLRSEAAVRASEEQYRRIVETTTEGIWTTDADDRTTYVNQRLVDMLGYRVDEMIGASVFDFMTENEQSTTRAHLERLRHGIAEQHDRTFLRKDGSELWTLLSMSPLTDDQGHFVGALKVVTDITERKKIETALERSERHFRLLIERAADVFMVIGEDGSLSYLSPSVQSVLGYAPRALVGTSPLGLIHPEDVSVAENTLTRIAQEPGVAQYAQIRCRHQDGSWRNCDVVGINLVDEPAVAGTVVTLRDVTERRRLEDQLRQAMKMEAIGQLAGGVAHDFNNLLGVILGAGELLLLQPGPVPRQGEYLTLIVKAAESAASLTRQLLVFSRRQVVEPRKVDLTVVVEALSPLLHRLIGDDIRLTVSLAGDLGIVNVDPGQIEQVLLNLASNARDAMPRGGTVTIKAANVELDQSFAQAHPGTQPGPHVMLAVTDTGQGMDPATQARIFEPFFTTKEVGKGTGLGLAMVYGIVKQSGGGIGVKTAVGQGTTIALYFPRMVPSSAGGQSMVETMPAARGSETILLVEDAANLRDLGRMVLETFGYTVLVADRGESALRIAAKHSGPIALLLVDMVMPGMNGREVADQLLVRYPTMRVLFMSGYTDDLVAAHGGLDDRGPFLQKPFGPRALALKVREVLDAPNRGEVGLVARLVGSARSGERPKKLPR